MNSWYSKIRKEIEAQYGDDADLFCDLLAATSPRKQVRSNWKLADKVYRHLNGSVPQCDLTLEVCLSSIGVMKPMIANVIRALRGEELHGSKVRAFAENLKGNLDKVTVDVWMLRLFDLKDSKKARKEVTEYVVRVAEEMGCKPAEVQAEMWCHSIRRAGREPKSFMAVAVGQRQLKLWEV